VPAIGPDSPPWLRQSRYRRHARCAHRGHGLRRQPQAHVATTATSSGSASRRTLRRCSRPATRHHQPHHPAHGGRLLLGGVPGRA